jgi:two-component system chemotaxis response regulator CheB
MGEHAAQRGHDLTARAFRDRHDETQAAALVIRRLLEDGRMNGEGMPDDVGEGAG